MKVIFKDTLNTVTEIPFAVYSYDERLSRYPRYIDIKQMVRQHIWEWLDEIQVSYNSIAKLFLKHTRWWWITAMSRLDVRPYLQDKTFKPFLFAKAVIEWKKNNPNADEIMLIGSDPMVGAYLTEFDNSIIIINNKNIISLKNRTKFVAKHLFLSMWSIVNCLYCITRFHLFKNPALINSPVAILYESVAGNSNANSYKYYFGEMFDKCEALDPSTFQYVCISYRRKTKKKIPVSRGSDKKCSMLLDNTNLMDLLKGLLVSAHIIFLTLIISKKMLPCFIGGNQSKIFWKRFLIHELGIGSHLGCFCCYKVLKRELEKKHCKAVIYPYEEKGIERAILFAANENKVDTIGYAPHPQYRLALALRENPAVNHPKPKKYRVCGPAYVDYFVAWGRKDRNVIDVWGTEKHIIKKPSLHRIDANNLNMLVLLSHPDELKIFYSWLKSEKRLVSNKTYFIRTYKAVNSETFEKILHKIQKEYDFVKETNRSFEDDLLGCDFAVFCATSAGLLSVNYGYLSVFLDLRGMFPINPCFDELDVMLKCYNSYEFANRIDELCQMDIEQITRLYLKQLDAVKRIFHPIQNELIRKDLECYKE